MVLFFAASATGARGIADGGRPDGEDADRRMRQLIERTRPRVDVPGDDSERQALLARAEAALALLDTEQAGLLFERAGFVRHAADAELGLIRVTMQSGQYRRALALAAHTAGAHPDAGAGAGLYAWLLHLGGQAQFASRVLTKARERLSDDPVLAAVAAMIDAPDPVPEGILLDPPGRFAPYADRATRPNDSAQVVASGVLIGGGTRVLTALRPGRRSNEDLIVRNGLGQSGRVSSIHEHADIGISVLELDTPIAVASVAIPVRDPFPGTSAFALDFSKGATKPSWPRMHIGFLGLPQQTAGTYRLGFTLRGGERGGPVFDATGRLIGIAGLDALRRDTITLTSVLRERLGASLGPAAAQVERIPIDEIYERGLVCAVQVLGFPE
ncbi:MAG: trypsin-like peptidase domain-containing protein [Burkholderiales bacterium]